MALTLQGAALESGINKITDNADEFSHQLLVFGMLLGKSYEAMLEEVYKEIFLTLVDRTPIDSGFCAMQWHITHGTPPTEKVDRVKSQWGRIGKTTVYDIKFSEFDAFDLDLNKEVNIYNNCVYLEKLEEEGWSDQAINGWIFLTINEFQDRLVRKAEKLGLF